MRVKIGNEYYDSYDQPIMLIFDDDEARKTVAKHLTGMPDKVGVRKYAIFDADVSREDAEAFMEEKDVTDNGLGSV